MSARRIIAGKIIGSVDNQGLISVMVDGDRVALIMCDPQGLERARKYTFTGDQAIQLGNLFTEAGVRFNINGKPVPRSS